MRCCSFCEESAEQLNSNSTAQTDCKLFRTGCREFLALLILALLLVIRFAYPSRRCLFSEVAHAFLDGCGAVYPGRREPPAGKSQARIVILARKIWRREARVIARRIQRGRLRRPGECTARLA